MEAEKKKTWKEKFLALMDLGKTDQEIFEEVNKDEKTLNSIAEVRRIKHMIKSYEG